MLVENSPASPLYDDLLKVPIAVQIGAFVIAKPLLMWINDGLMALFFFLVGLEIKREILDGELSNPQQIVLPAVAAVGGMAVPAAVYSLFKDDPSHARLGHSCRHRYRLRAWRVKPARRASAGRLETVSSDPGHYR